MTTTYNIYSNDGIEWENLDKEELKEILLNMSEKYPNALKGIGIEKVEIIGSIGTVNENFIKGLT